MLSCKLRKWSLKSECECLVTVLRCDSVLLSNVNRCIQPSVINKRLLLAVLLSCAFEFHLRGLKLLLYHLCYSDDH